MSKQPVANIVINIAVDTTYVYAQQQGMYQSGGIYMMDNNSATGSQGEGGLELNTYGSDSQWVAFNVFPINGLQNDGSSVEIMGIEQSSGTNVFGNTNWPAQQPAGSPYQYLGFLTYSGNMTYQLKIGVTNGGSSAAQYYTWDPFFTITA